MNDEPSLYIRNDKPPSLEEAQKLVGGYVQLIWVHQGQLLVDEDGIMKQLPINHRASRLAGQRIVGNAMYLRGSAMWVEGDENGDGLD